MQISALLVATIEFLGSIRLPNVPPAQQLTSAQIAFGLANFPLDFLVSSRFEKDTTFTFTAVTRGELRMQCSDQR